MIKKSSKLTVFFARYWYLLAVLIIVTISTLNLYGLIPLFPKIKPKPPKLTTSSSSDYLFEAKNQIFESYLASPQTKKPVYKFHSKAGGEATFTYQGVAEGKVVRNENSLIFANVDPNTDFVYTPTASGIKEEITIKNKVSQYNAIFNLNVVDAYPRKKPDGTYGSYFYDRSNKYQFQFEKPFAKDANGNITNDVKLNLRKSKENENQYQISIEVSSTWLSDSNRLFPVVVDPTIIYDTSAEFVAGTLNRILDTGSGSSPNLITNYQELSSDQYTVGLWHLNESSGNATDASGNNNTGTATGTSVVTGILGSARSFNGSSDRIVVANSTTFPKKDITIEAWINITSTSSVNRLISGISSEHWIVYDGQNWGCGTSQIGYMVYLNSAWVCTSGFTPATNHWYHIAGVYDGSTVSLYVDGKLVSSVRGGGYPISTSNSFDVGDYNAGGYGVPIIIDEVRLSNKARSADEILLDAKRRPYSVYTSDVIDLTNVGAWSPFTWTELGVKSGDGETPKDNTGLVAQWNFNETSGTALTNNAGTCGTSCNGTLTNFSSTTSQDSQAGSGWTSANRRWGTGALMFDGTNDYITVPDNNFLSFGSGGTDTPFTINMWVMPRSLAGVDLGWLINKRSGSTSDEYQLVFYQGKIWWGVFSSNTIYIGQNTVSTFKPGQWYQITATYDGSKSASGLKIYVNGKLEPSTSATSGSYSGMNNGSEPVVIGKQGWSSSAYFDGIIDSTSIYSRALDANEILSNYNSSNLEIQTRVGNSTTPDDGSWEEWKPVSGETSLETYDGPYLYNTTDSGLVSYWPMDETSNDTCSGGQNDICDRKNTNDGATTNSYITNGIFGNARSFDGSSSFVNLGTSTSLNFERTDAFSVESWIKTKTVTNSTVYSKYDGSRGFIYFVLSDGRLRLSLINTGSTNQIRCTTTQVVNDNRWHHVAFTYSGTSLASGVTMYIDGINQNASCDLNNLTATILTSATASIGSSNGDSFFYQGDIDETRVYNDVLQSSTIWQHYLVGSTHPETLLSSLDTVTKVEGSASQKIKVGFTPVDAYTVGLWHLDETSGTGAYLKDSTANANHGTPTNTSVTSGYSNKARSFGGSSGNGYIDIPNSSVFDLQNFTIEAWINPTTTDQSGFIFEKGSVNTQYSCFLNGGGGDTFYFRTINSVGTSDDLTFKTSTFISPNRWNYVVCSYDGSYKRVFINGVEIANKAYSQTLKTGQSGERIGAYGGVTPSYYFSGKIDEVRVSNIARTASEIAENYRAGSNHYLNFSLISSDLSGKSTIPFYIAADRPGTYLSSTLGESAFANYQPDNTTVGLWHLDEQNSILRDTFSGGSLGSGWTKTDPHSVMSVNNGLTLTGSPNAWDTAIVSNTTFSRAQGLTAYIRFTTGSSLGYMMFGLANNSTSTASYSNISHALYFNNGSFYIFQDGSSLGAYGSGYTANTTYEAKVSLSASGNTASYWVKGGSYTNWTLLLATDNSKTSTPLRVQVADYSHLGTIKEISVTSPAISVVDSSGNNNHGISVGTTNTRGIIGGARSFDDASDTIIIPVTGIDTTAGHTNTVDFWMYWTGKTGIIPFGWSSNYDLWINSATCFGFNTSSGETIGAPLPQNQWVHVVAVFYNGTPTTSNSQLYINGQRQSISYCLGSTSASRTVSTTAYISGFGSSPLYKFNGLIDEVRISTGTRTADEIRQAYEIGSRTHQITIDFGAKLDSGNLISDTNDISFTVDATYYGLTNKGSNLYLGDKIVVEENVDGTEYIAQGTVTSVSASTGAVTINAWDSGSTAPSGGYSANASVFKWQREYWDLSKSLSGHIDSVKNLTFRITSGSEGRTVWLDDLKSSSNYLTDPSNSTITSQTGNRYLQYRAIEHSTNKDLSTSLSTVNIDYTKQTPNDPTMGTPTALTSTSIAWNFTDNSDNEDGFKLFDSSGSDLGFSSSANNTTITETGLSVNTQYIRKILAYNTYGNSAYTSTATIYTLANTPGQVNVTRSTTTTSQFTLDANSNPVTTEYAIYKEQGTSCDGSGGSYLNTDGSDNADTVVWATLSNWGDNGVVTVTNLDSESKYAFCVKARNGDSVETNYSQVGTTAGEIVPISGDLTINPGTGNTASLLTRYRDGSDQNRYIIGLDTVGTNSINSSELTLAGGSLTVNSNETLVAGKFNFTGGTLFIASDGGRLAPGAKLYAIDRDQDGFPDSLGGEIKVWYATDTPTSTISASYFRRKALLSTLATADCNDNSYNTSNICCTDQTYYLDSDSDGYGSTTSYVICQETPSTPPGYSTNNTDCNDGSNQVWVSHSQCYADVDGDTYTGGLATNTTCLNSSSCATTTRSSASTDGATVSTYTAGRLLDNASVTADCYDSNANAKPGSTYCSSANRGDGSYDYNCDGSSAKCGTNYNLRPTTLSYYPTCYAYNCGTSNVTVYVSSTVNCGSSGYVGCASSGTYKYSCSIYQDSNGDTKCNNGASASYCVVPSSSGTQTCN